MTDQTNGLEQSVQVRVMSVSEDEGAASAPAVPAVVPSEAGTGVEPESGWWRLNGGVGVGVGGKGFLGGGEQAWIMILACSA